MQVAKHDIGFPPPHELDKIGVDSGPDEGHGTASPQGAGADFAPRDTKLMANLGTAIAELLREVGSQHVLGTLGTENSVQRGVRQGLPVAEVPDAPTDGGDRRKESIKGVAMCNGFISLAILLCGEIQEDSVCCIQGGIGDGDTVGCRCAVEGEQSIAEVKRMMIVRIKGVLPRTEHIKEADDQGVSLGCLEGVGKIKPLNHMTYELQWYRLDALRWRIF